MTRRPLGCPLSVDQELNERLRRGDRIRAIAAFLAVAGVAAAMMGVRIQAASATPPTGGSSIGEQREARPAPQSVVLGSRLAAR